MRGIKYAIYCSLLLGLYFLGNSLYMLAKANLAQVLLERSWNQTIEQVDDEIQRPWPWADFYPAGKLSFVDLELSYVIANVDSGQALAFAPGFSAKNIINNDSVNIISAHNDTHFSVLERIKAGDKLTLETRNKVIKHYQVENTYIIDSREEFMQVDLNSDDNGILYLVTCYPFKGVEPSTPYRYVVQASYSNSTSTVMARNL